MGNGATVAAYFAGIVALLGSIGAACSWLFSWRDKREESRASKLQKWEDELKGKEIRIDDEQRAHFTRVESRLSRVETQLEAVLNAYHLVVGKLRQVDPTSSEIGLAHDILTEAFRIPIVTPADMKAEADKIARGQAV